MSAIQDQVRLPIRVAFGVVVQGIRIRFGRSLVTIMGVMFGVAFLMSILTGETVKRGVSEEDQLRSEVKRMYSFLTSEIGLPEGRNVGVVQVGELIETERRLIELLGEEGLDHVRWVQTASALLPVEIKNTEVVAASLDDVGDEVSAVLLMGGDEGPDVAWTDILANSRQPVVALARSMSGVDSDGTFSVVNLARGLREDELEKIEKEKKKSRARTIWIVAIALVVTVIGISNAMLMSVTERFREIGTMKCLGALSAFVRQIFLIESSLVGLVGGISGAVVGALFSVCVYGLIYGFGMVLGSLEWLMLVVYMVSCIVGGVVLAVLAALYPARVASSMIPAAALRTEI